jgi:hypothetical protein
MNSSEEMLVSWWFFLAGTPLLIAGPVGSRAPAAPDKPTVIVRETAGIRRFGYPVHIVLSRSEAPAQAPFYQLLEHGKSISAQFQTRAPGEVDLDFNVSLGPFERREYQIRLGEPPNAQRPAAGIQVNKREGRWHVSHGRELEFVVPGNLPGLLQQVRTPQVEYLRPGSAGLLIRYKDGRDLRAGQSTPTDTPAIAEVTRSGPLAGALRFQSTQTLRGDDGIASLVELDFPVSKSWVEVRWTVQDVGGYVAGLGVEVNLNIQGEPTLVDFGAGSLVYAQLRKGEAAVMRAGSLTKPSAEHPAWETLTGPAGALTPYVTAPRGPHVHPAEGWAHIMDRERCTAVAVADFAAPKQEAEITVHADGRLKIWKHFARGGAAVPRGSKELHFWLHFVGMPVHIGAATSPQAMLAPLAVEVRRQPKEK